MAIQQMLLGIGGGSVSQWISQVHNNSASKKWYVRSVDINSDNHIFAAGALYDTSYKDFGMISYDEEGTIRWFKREDYHHDGWGNSGQFQTEAKSVRCDSNGDPYMWGMYATTFKLSKSNGSTQISRNHITQPYSFNVTEENNITLGTGVFSAFGYLDGKPTHTASTLALTGACNFFYQLTSNTDTSSAKGIVGINESGSGYYYLLMQSNPTDVSGSNRQSTRLLKATENGSSYEWQRELYYSNSDESGNYHPFEARNHAGIEDHIVVVGLHKDGDHRPGCPFIAKWNSSGTIQWRKLYGKSVTTKQAISPFNHVAVDSSGNAYCLGFSQGQDSDEGAVGNGKRGMIVAKINTDGTLGWGRYINENQSNWSDSSHYGESIKVSADGKFIIIGGYKEGSNVTGVHGFVMKLDSKGPSTGTFGTWVIGELETTGTYPWTISDAGGSERSQTAGTWSSYNRSTSDADSDDYSVSWSASTLTTVS
tara:strand:+ start:1517 stop:2959 length:1443 start_codon:yes stop_codon:yes gene_type:complete